jgi:outer membrane protein assembly factor BamE (lipoprotein component of BamABCDE complex)
MKIRTPLIVLAVLGLAAFAAVQETEIDSLVAWLCSSAAAQDPQTQQALKIQVGSATREDVVRLLGQPWRTMNDADCDADQYGETWEYLVEEANGAFFRIHVAFNKDGKASLVARIPQHGEAVVLAYIGEKEHSH